MGSEVKHHRTDHSQNHFNARNTNIDLLKICKSPIDLTVLKQELTFYMHDDKELLLKGFTEGFSLQYKGPREFTQSKNLKSASDHPEIIKEKIEEEVKAGRVAGPFEFSNLPIQTLRVSPIGLVPKKNGKFRMIHHLSHPKGNSLNDFIDPKLCSVQYTSFDEAIHMLQDLKQGCYLFKFDIKHAFRLLPVHPDDFDQLGFRFLDAYFIDLSMPFGCSISCSSFEKFACFLEFCIRRRMTNAEGILHYLDDFLGGHQSLKTSKNLLKLCNDVLENLKVPVASEKTVGPVQVLTFLGLELDSKEMVVRMPQDKITELLDKISDMLSKEKTTLKAMQSLIGSLNFACRVIRPGRPFCRRLINATCGLTKPHHHLRVNRGIKLDLQMWLRFFKSYNGISVFYDRHWSCNASVQLFTDSAGGFGFGAYFQGHWCSGGWPQKWRQDNITSDITLLELFPIFVSLHVWGEQLRDKKIIFNCDNAAVVHILNSCSSKSERVMILVRCITMHCLKHNILIKAQHVFGSKNEICDALSRFQWERFRTLAPEADSEQCQIPNHLWEIFSQESHFY